MRFFSFLPALLSVIVLNSFILRQAVLYAETDPDYKIEKRLIRRIVFKPPKRGAPAVRMGAGIRGADLDSKKTLPELTVLTPPLETGITVHDQPSLFWYLSKPADIPLEITVNKEFDTSLELKFKTTPKAGIQRLNLAEYNVHLETGVEYEWTTFLVPDADQRAKEMVR